MITNSKNELLIKIISVGMVYHESFRNVNKYEWINKTVDIMYAIFELMIKSNKINVNSENSIGMNK
jgi:hypothetical protein